MKGPTIFATAVENALCCFYRCCLSLLTQVTNAKKETSLKWFKDGLEVTRVAYDPSSGVSVLTIPQVCIMIVSCSIFRDGKYESSHCSWCRERKEINRVTADIYRIKSTWVLTFRWIKIHLEVSLALEMPLNQIFGSHRYQILNGECSEYV